MIKKPTFPYLKLWELAKEWNNKFKGCDLTADDILRYGINGDLAIYAEIPHPSCEVVEEIYMDRDDFQKTYPDKFDALSEEEKQKKNFCVDKKRYNGPYFEALQEKDLQTIYLEGAVKLTELHDPHNPNRILRNPKIDFVDLPTEPFLKIITEPFAKLTKKNLCILRKDITAFEKEYFLAEEPINSINKVNTTSVNITRVTKETATYNTADHNSFAPELAIAGFNVEVPHLS